MPAGGGDHDSFRISYDTEPDWDFVFVEIHNRRHGHVGRPLPTRTATPATTPVSPAPRAGSSCTRGWSSTKGADCSGAGWNASSGRSNGWEEWSIDLDGFAQPDEEIEVFISYASDWASQGLGTFVDSIQMPGEAVESFETDEGAWSVVGPPAGSDPNPNNWIRTTGRRLPGGGIVSMTPTTADFVTLYFGFGFEGITDASSRQDIMDASLSFLGV